MPINRFILDKEDTLILIIDVQERLAAVMKTEVKDQVVKNCRHLIELAKMLNIPVMVTEQYPKGLGPTVPELREATAAVKPVEKIAFNCCGEPAFMKEVRALDRKKIIVTGMEMHICVLQTTLGLLKADFVPHVVSDAVCSRTKANWRTSLDLMRSAGAVVTGTETVLFQLLGVAGTEEFKAISKRIK